MDHKKLLQAYIIGFILSIILTLTPYFLVVNHITTSNTLLILILGLAFIQLIVQLAFFLHLGREPKPKWNLVFFISTVGIVFIVVGGSLWIMNHLNYNMMPTQMDQQILQDEGITNYHP
jgi:cytochrome o ubiquinol oxidase operon protein cyoD